MKTCQLLFALVALSVALEGRAQLIAYDSFSGYPASSINGQGYGTGWTGLWDIGAGQDIFGVDPPNDLTYSGLTGALGRFSAGSSASAGLKRDFPAVNSGTIYFGAVVQYPGGSTNIRTFYLTASEGNGGMVDLGQYSGSGAATTTQWLNIDTTIHGGTALHGVNTGILVTGDPTYLVARIDFNTSGLLDSAWLWVNPTSVSDLDTSHASASSLSLYDVGTLSAFGYYVDTSVSGGNGGYMDEVRISRSATDMFGVAGAVPEPSTYAALTGLAALGFALLRQRRKR